MTAPGRWRAITALLLLLPATPMLFQGQEFSASAPFLYFADFDAELNDAVRRGRAEFLHQFPSLTDTEIQAGLAIPGAIETFERCKLDMRERESNAAAYALHTDLLRLRRDEPVFSAAPFGGIDGAVLSASAFALRYFTPDHVDDRLLVVNLGTEMVRGSFAEPLLAPPPPRRDAGKAPGDRFERTDWALRWSSERASYGGSGTPDPFPDGCWRIPAQSALFLGAGPKRPRQPLPIRRRTA